MKAVIFEADSRLRVDDSYPRPEPGPGEVLLRVHTAGICMTDVHIVRGHFPVPTPRVLGHELSGIVEAVGENVTGEWLEQAVGVSPARFCGTCTPCRRGNPELCANFECLGNTHDGGFAEYAVARESQLIPLEGLSLEDAAWLEPLACVLHAVEKAQVGDATAVLVSGAGTLGKLLVQALHASTTAPVAVVDPSPAKVEAARACGAEAGWVVPRRGIAQEATAGLQQWAPDGVQAVIETSGVPLAIERAVDWAGPAARVVLFGVSDAEARVTLSPTTLLSQELAITAVAGMTPSSFAVAHRLLRQGNLALSSLVSDFISLDEVPAAIEAMLQGSRGKVMVKPG